MATEPAVIGFSVHTGWAITVAVSGGPSRIEVLFRERVELLPPEIPRFVYHEAAELKLADAGRLVKRAEEAAREAGRQAIAKVTSAPALGGRRIKAVAISEKRPVAAKPLEEILASHPAIHRAEGSLYRDAVARAATDCGVPVVIVRDAADAALKEKVAALRRTLGAPWNTDHQTATLAALAAAAGRTSRGSRQRKRTA